MSIYINNTITGKKEKFTPIKEGKVGIYVCGPTVYDNPHIGHVRSSLMFEVIRRYFEFRGYRVKFIKNITDIDDKVIQTAMKIKDGDTNIMQKVKKIARKYEEVYHQHMSLLGIQRADIEPRATEHINEMINMIRDIIKQGYGYEVDGSVYFSVRECSTYGELSGQSIEKIGKQKRLYANENKKDALDFALWKKSTEDEPGWESPWGRGRPGWHIECSVMSIKYLGEKFDIHCGGRDLIFPHHENEIAQAKAIGSDFANYWIHNGLLSIGGEKMSKSLGNFVTVVDVLKKYTPEALNLLFLTTHYSNPLDFTWDKLEGAEKSAERFRILFNKLKSLLSNTKEDKLQLDERRLDKISQGFKQNLERLFREFNKAMDDDFNTALALSKMFDIVNNTNKFLDKKNKDLKYQDKKLLLEAKNNLQQMNSILCIFSKAEGIKAEDELGDKLLNLLIQVRETARKEKLFNFADEIREKLKIIGVILEDTEEGTKYRIRLKQ